MTALACLCMPSASRKAVRLTGGKGRHGGDLGNGNGVLAGGHRVAKPSGNLAPHTGRLIAAAT
jgi:hypothetical protein